VFPEDRVAWDLVIPWKERLLRRSFEHFSAHALPGQADALVTFAGAPEQAGWLADWSLFSALRKRAAGAPWWSWEPALAKREPSGLDRARRELRDEIAFQVYAQFQFFRQWERVKREANTCGIAVMGDAPIYVSQDSSDVWAHRELFQLDTAGRPAAVAGVPPDYFSPTGQLWGNPLYRWERMEENGFAWWIERLRANLRLCDLLRIDHFRAFAAYWSVRAGEVTALKGRWIEAPGEKLFAAARAALGGLPIVAEDLGVITPDVEALLTRLGVPGMKVLQFAFYELNSAYLPHRHVPNSVVYTGTHDNDTARGWFGRLSPEEKGRVTEYLGGDGSRIEWDLIRAAFASVCDRAIVPLQDVFGLGSEARMNNPAAPGGNWGWRAEPSALAPELAARVRRLAELTARVPAP
jgi:4-alpha-glucanotransferase